MKSYVGQNPEQRSLALHNGKWKLSASPRWKLSECPLFVFFMELLGFHYIGMIDDLIGHR